MLRWSLAGPDLRTGKDPLDWAAVARVDRRDDMKNLPVARPRLFHSFNFSVLFYIERREKTDRGPRADAVFTERGDWRDIHRRSVRPASADPSRPHGLNIRGLQTPRGGSA